MRPVLFEIGPVAIYAYGFFLACAFLAGIWVATWLGQRDNIEESLILNTAMGIIFSSLIGAKILYVLVNWSDVTGSWDEFMSAIQRGFVFYGGFIGALIFCFAFLPRFLDRIPTVPGFLDILAPATALGLGIARWGCFFSGCCYGGPCTVPWGVTFPPDSFAASAYGVDHFIHPAQIYASLLGLLTFGLLLVVHRYRRFYGQTTATFLVIYGLYRPVLEHLRGDSARGVYFGFTTSQWISVAMVAGGIGMLIWVARNSRYALRETSAAKA